MDVPSRRQVLATTGSALAGGFGGCLSTVGLARRGYLQIKSVTVEWTHGNRRHRDQVLQITSDGRNRIRGRVAERYAGLVRTPTDIVTTDEIHKRLTRDFENVRYGLGFCEEGGGNWCRNALSTRRGFDRVQFGDRAEVRIRGDEFRVLDVYDGDATGWEVDVRTFDFAALHADDGR